MTIYKLAIVTRYKDDETMIAEVDSERNFRKLSTLTAYRDTLLKQGYGYQNMDITVHTTAWNDSEPQYNKTLNSKTLQDTGY